MKVDEHGMCEVEVNGRTERRHAEVLCDGQQCFGASPRYFNRVRPVVRADEVLVEMIDGTFIVARGRS